MTQERYLFVSTDSHVGPSLKNHLRPYCETRYLEAFDDDLARTEAHLAAAASKVLSEQDPLSAAIQGGDTVAAGRLGSPTDTPAMKQRRQFAETVPGLQDPTARLSDMDAEGVAADVIFAGGQNGELLPFDTSKDATLHRLGYDIFNRWLRDYCSAAPERLIGVAQITMDDIPDAVRQVTVAAEAGFRTVNFPAPRRGLLPYTEPDYEPFWDACDDLQLTLNTHGGGGDRGYWTGPGARFATRAEGHFFGRRALWGLIFGGVFERHPDLHFVLTEQFGSWVPTTLAELDDIYEDNLRVTTGYDRMLPRRPSEYWARQVYLADSFMSRTEALARHDIGIGQIMYGTDYPHAESIYPLTRLALRHTFSGIDPKEVAMMLGGNAVKCFRLDEAPLRAIADRIGPTVEEVSQPTTDEELAGNVPPFCLGFRAS